MEEYQKFNDAINGFSPSFVRILLDRLKEIKKPDTTGVYRNHNATIKPFLGAVLYHLRSQVLGDNGPFCGQITSWRLSELMNETIMATEEFLTLFEDKKNKKFITDLGPEIEEISESEELVKKISKFGEKGVPEEHKSGFRTDLSPCHQAPIEITNGGLRQEICSGCKKPINEVLFKISKT